MVREEPWQLPKVLGRQEKHVSNMAVKQKNMSEALSDVIFTPDAPV